MYHTSCFAHQQSCFVDSVFTDKRPLMGRGPVQGAPQGPGRTDVLPTLAVLVGQEGRTLADLPVNCRTLAVLLRPRSEDLFVEGPSVRSAPHLCADHDFSGLAGGVTQFSRFALDSPSEHFSSFAPKVSYFSTTTPGW